ncbi:MAG: DUF3422 family protein [Limimaricola sp.]|uniref:DUF3422 family protein n=1 Tax=Limimaricola sp. TaxID=2211665 RepID=UPI001DB6DB5E|nr:DUF3422 domain-containing protein [Limimaricola sp.]MBI1418526.1 DUF3422 family protein [Limimaricola sp.]
MPPIPDHPLRYAMANELHARPFPNLRAPSRAAYLAMKPAQNAAGRDREADRLHLISLLDRFGAPHPQPGATHYFGEIGRHRLKWESHTEFVTYTILGDGVAERPFDAATFGVFPDDWLSEAPGTRVTSALIRIEELTDEASILPKVEDWFVPESVAVSRVIDGQLVIAADFRIDVTGHMRFAVFADPETGDRRIGRVVQRLCEIETYKAMAMLGLARARALSEQMGVIDGQLSALIAHMADETAQPAETLHELLAVSAQLENIVAQSQFRFGATGAYETIVNQRIDVLREERIAGRQTFREFMTRRFDPAMRTVKSTEARLHAMSARAARAADLLRTRVDVQRSAQNQELLTSMDKRADLQLQLQKTVEGLSVVAISYYALNLVTYLLLPLAEAQEVPKEWVMAGATPVVVLAVWLMVRRIRRHFH